jgi:septum formation protein
MIILASTSPRRRELLSRIVKEFKCIEPKLDESQNQFFKISDLSRNLAKLKAYSVFNEHKNDCVIASDTVVILKHEVMGKPADEKAAESMLMKLNGKKHIVISSYCILYKDYEITKSIKSIVVFNKNSKQALQTYIESGLWKGKAGAYGVQDKEYNLIKEVKGSYYNVVGLPLEELEKDLIKLDLII